LSPQLPSRKTLLGCPSPFKPTGGRRQKSSCLQQQSSPITGNSSMKPKDSFGAVPVRTLVVALLRPGNPQNLGKCLLMVLSKRAEKRRKILTWKLRRDQQHVQLGLGNFVEAFTTLQIQQDPTDWFGLLNNRLATGLEYTAKFLLGNSVPYDKAFARCNANLLGGPWKKISSTGTTPVRPVWELGFAIYSARGVSMPYTKRLIDKHTPDGPNPKNSISDGSAWQTLRFRRK
jgi:hypothetical protein